jgi:hypothetical protein
VTRALVCCALLASGCTVTLVDPCVGVSGTCVTVQVAASPRVTQISGLSLAVAGAGLSDRLSRVPGIGGATVKLPVAIAVELGSLADTPADITITLQAQPTGHGSRLVHGLANGAHANVTIALDTIATGGDDMAAINEGEDMALADGGPGSGASNRDMQGQSGDMVCVPTKEDCFNGIDDDCNGLVDCADHAACDPVAICIPTMPGATYGTVLKGNPPPACPLPGSTGQLLYGGLSAANFCTGCTSQTTTPPKLFAYNGSCGGTLLASSASGCSLPAPFLSPNFFSAMTGTCSTPSGTPTPVPISFVDKFCAHSVGGGCDSTHVCAPKVSPPQYECVMTKTPMTCTGMAFYNFSLTGPDGKWFTDKTDTRVCNTCESSSVSLVAQYALCTNTGSGGDCAGTCNPFIATQGSCMPEQLPTSGTYSIQLSSSSGDGFSCNISTTLASGSLTAAGTQMYVCCN